MDSHLSSAQLERMLAGKPEPNVVKHISRCARCADEVEATRTMFSGLQVSATAAAERQWRLARVPERRPLPRMAWAGAMAALFLAVSAPVVLRKPVVVNPTQTAPVTVASVSDEALLSSIQNDLSSSVPEPLQPLANTATQTQQTNSTSQRISQ